MSRKSKGTFTCKIVAQNERGMLGQVRDSVYRGVKYCGGRSGGEDVLLPTETCRGEVA